jgi:inward rectifier potassium channel
MAKRGSDEIEVIGLQRHPLRDSYHTLIRARWPVTISVLVGVFLAVNVLFALAFFFAGGISGAHGLVDSFFFSIETAATIGYGEMFPTTKLTHFLVTVEAMVSLLMVALTTGLVFAKFSVPRARVRFAEHPVVSPYDGVPTLMFRLGNERDSRLIEAVLRVVMIRTEKTREGVTYYRMYDLQLERDRSPALARSWTVLHKLQPSSPLHGVTPESLARDEVEMTLTLVGLDEVSAQALHAQRRYLADEVRFGMRHADMLSERGDGGLQLDMGRFHELVETAPTEDFPYPIR